MKEKNEFPMDKFFSNLTGKKKNPNIYIYTLFNIFPLFTALTDIEFLDLAKSGTETNNMLYLYRTACKSMDATEQEKHKPL